MRCFILKVNELLDGWWMHIEWAGQVYIEELSEARDNPDNVYREV